jgi:hypothetical protein
MKKLVLLLVISMVGCTHQTTAIRVLQDQGYKNIVITGWRPFSCQDSFATGFEATNSNGKFVTGVVCEGWLKAATLRFD